jgi:hypothetical protein
MKGALIGTTIGLVVGAVAAYFGFVHIDRWLTDQVFEPETLRERLRSGQIDETITWDEVLAGGVGKPAGFWQYRDPEDDSDYSTVVFSRGAGDAVYIWYHDRRAFAAAGTVSGGVEWYFADRTKLARFLDLTLLVSSIEIEEVADTSP